MVAVAVAVVEDKGSQRFKQSNAASPAPSEIYAQPLGAALHVELVEGARELRARWPELPRLQNSRWCAVARRARPYRRQRMARPQARASVCRGEWSDGRGGRRPPRIAHPARVSKQIEARLRHGPRTQCLNLGTHGVRSERRERWDAGREGKRL